MADMNAAIAEYIPMVEEAARVMRRGPVSDFEDLRQLGLIAVWQMLTAGDTPTPELVSDAITRAMKGLRRHKTYDELIPGGAA